MEAMKLTVTRGGTPETYRVTPLVHVMFERHWSTSLARAFGQDGQDNRLEHMYWLAWKSAEVAGKTTAGFDEWLSDVEAVDIDTEEVVPLARTPSAGS
jgi:hypothetical protein